MKWSLIVLIPASLVLLTARSVLGLLAKEGVMQ